MIKTIYLLKKRSLRFLEINNQHSKGVIYIFLVAALIAAILLGFGYAIGRSVQIASNTLSLPISTRNAPITTNPIEPTIPSRIWAADPVPTQKISPPSRATESSVPGSSVPGSSVGLFAPSLKKPAPEKTNPEKTNTEKLALEKPALEKPALEKPMVARVAQEIIESVAPPRASFLQAHPTKLHSNPEIEISSYAAAKISAPPAKLKTITDVTLPQPKNSPEYNIVAETVSPVPESGAVINPVAGRIADSEQSLVSKKRKTKKQEKEIPLTRETFLAAFHEQEEPASVPAPVPAWRRFAAIPSTPPGSGPLIGLVIDDLGMDRAKTRRAIRLPTPLTLSFLPYAKGLPALTAAARQNQHELMIHIPMEPNNPHINPGPNTLRVSDDIKTLHKRMQYNLSRFEAFVGINNHMGSRLTRSAPHMAQIMGILRRNGLIYFDSRTVVGSVGPDLAKRYGVPHISRDIFLDNDPDTGAILDQLRRVENIATKTGKVVAIAHPRKATLTILERWLPSLVARGFQPVPITTLIQSVNTAPSLAAIIPEKPDVNKQE